MPLGNGLRAWNRETWLTDGQDLVDDIDHLALATGFRLLCKNREKNNRGFSHGGIALAFRESELMLKEVKLHNPERFEVIMAAGKVNGCGRKLVVVGCYIPPNYNIGRGKKALEFIAGAVTEAKRRFDDPLIVLSLIHI